MVTVQMISINTLEWAKESPAQHDKSTEHHDVDDLLHSGVSSEPNQAADWESRYIAARWGIISDR